MSCIIPQLGKKGKIISADFRKYSWKRKSSAVEKTPVRKESGGTLSVPSADAPAEKTARRTERNGNCK
jgi:hypothetical protein